MSRNVIGCLTILSDLSLLNQVYLEAFLMAHSLGMHGYAVLSLDVTVHLQPSPSARKKRKKITFSTGKIHQNELATPISLQQQFATCLATNLLGDIISQEKHGINSLHNMILPLPSPPPHFTKI